MPAAEFSKVGALPAEESGELEEISGDTEIST
jgi:hypothetical protein